MTLAYDEPEISPSSARFTVIEGSPELTNAGASPEGGAVAAVAGIPEPLLAAYVNAAADHAVAREIEPGLWIARTVGLDGAWSEGASEKEALYGMPEVIENWVIVKLRLQAGDIPPINGINLNPQ